ncbi:unnamed protein product [Rotaria socialis]|uniref:Uncharacterized protein n=1 Tax=Rotaria socialis TaxID=392032 RepID=A0A821HR93_9BILA|nr:unnamed protein product [Rotaria socialis]
MKRKRQNVPNKIEETNTYNKMFPIEYCFLGRLCNNRRQEERRKRLANVFASNDIILADPSVMFVEGERFFLLMFHALFTVSKCTDVSVFAEEENVDDDTLEDLSEQCNQGELF